MIGATLPLPDKNNMSNPWDAFETRLAHAVSEYAKTFISSGFPRSVWTRFNDVACYFQMVLLAAMIMSDSRFLPMIAD